MSVRDDLERQLGESYALVRDYEDMIRTSDRPEEKARGWRLIQEQKANLVPGRAGARRLAREVV
jgi:hypothetical protein